MAGMAAPLPVQASHSATEEANVDHITGRPASTHLQVWTLYTVSEGECERQEDRQRST